LPSWICTTLFLALREYKFSYVSFRPALKISGPFPVPLFRMYAVCNCKKVL